MPITTLNDAIQSQIEINEFLAKNGIRDLVGDYGELLILKALGGEKQTVINKGFDIKNHKFGKIEVKTRKYELKRDGKVVRENRAVGFSGKENSFDWLAHVVLNENYEVVNACLAKYAEVWLKILDKNGKVGYSTSSNLPSSIDITDKVKKAQIDLNYGI